MDLVNHKQKSSLIISTYQVIWLLETHYTDVHVILLHLSTVPFNRHGHWQSHFLGTQLPD